MARATGFCFKCRAPVPETNLNKFYCSDPCRKQAYEETLQREREERGRFDYDE